MKTLLTSILLLLSTYSFSQSYDYDAAAASQDVLYRNINLTTGKEFFQDIYGATALVTWPDRDPKSYTVEVIKANIKVLDNIKADWNNPVTGDKAVIRSYINDFKNICNDDSDYCHSVDDFDKEKVINAEAYWDRMYADWNKLLSSNPNNTSDDETSTSNSSNNTASSNSSVSQSSTTANDNEGSSLDSGLSQETQAEKAARIDRERGAQIIQETDEKIANVKATSEAIGKSLNQISNGIASALQERDRKKALENEKKEKAYQNAIANRDKKVAAIEEKQNLITDEKMASLKSADFANWDLYKLKQNINNLQNLRSLTLTNYRSKGLPNEIAQLKNLETLSIDLLATGDLTSDLLNGGAFKLNSAIKNLKNLRSISFIGNGYLTKIIVEPIVFETLENLESFTVYSKFLKSLPKALINSEYVEKIYLYYHPKNRKNAKNKQLKDDLKFIKSKTCLIVKFQDGTKPIFGKKCN